MKEKDEGNQREWARLSHHDKYRHLIMVRENFLVSSRALLCPADPVYELDARHVTDIPSFYLLLGEILNGEEGYYGACLNSLADCLCGGFGPQAPFTLNIAYANELRSNLDKRAWVRFILEERLSLFDGPDSLEHLEDQGVSAAIDLEHSYFDELLDLFKRGSVTVNLID